MVPALKTPEVWWPWDNGLQTWSGHWHRHAGVHRGGERLHLLFVHTFISSVFNICIEHVNTIARGHTSEAEIGPILGVP